MRLLLEAEPAAYDIFSDEYDNLSDDTKYDIAVKTIQGTKANNLKSAYPAYAQKLASIATPNDRKAYIEFIKKIPVDLDVTTVETINQLIDSNKLDMARDQWLHDRDFYGEDADRSLRNKIKTVAFFKEPENRKTWHVSDDIIATQFQTLDGGWKSFNEIQGVLDEIQNNFETYAAQKQQGKEGGSTPKETGAEALSKILKKPITIQLARSYASKLFNQLDKAKLNNGEYDDELEKALSKPIVSSLGRTAEEVIKSNLYKELKTELNKDTITNITDPRVSEAIQALKTLKANNEEIRKALDVIKIDKEDTSSDITRKILKVLKP